MKIFLDTIRSLIIRSEFLIFLMNSLIKIKNRENTLLLVEHNPYFLEKSDEVIYIGPKAGKNGGEKITKEEYELKDREKLEAEVYTKSKNKTENFFEIKNITKNNLENINIKIPSKSLVGVYGVSGSGKSTLCKEMAKKIENSIYIDQKPIRGTTVSTIGSYSGTLFEDIRKEIAQNLKLVNPNVFNFNSDEGKCKNCDGKGKIKFQYDYGKEIEVLCPSCRGKRYSENILKDKKYQYKKYNIYEILNLSIDELITRNIFESLKINNKLNLLNQLGLGHLNLFRTTDTLSGGESQRVKLSDALGKNIKDKILFFDEPLSGLSFKDSINILKIFKLLTSKGATVVFIEHNVMGIKACDYIVEVGPGKGKDGGRIIFQDSLEKFMESDNYKKYEKFSSYKSI